MCQTMFAISIASNTVFPFYLNCFMFSKILILFLNFIYLFFIEYFFIDGWTDGRNYTGSIVRNRRYDSVLGGIIVLSAGDCLWAKDLNNWRFIFHFPIYCLRHMLFFSFPLIFFFQIKINCFLLFITKKRHERSE